jgi:hypothetical protein
MYVKKILIPLNSTFGTKRIRHHDDDDDDENDEDGGCSGGSGGYD